MKMPPKHSSSKPISHILILFLFLLVPCFTHSQDEDLDDLEQLIAIDNQDEDFNNNGGSLSSEANVLSKAQRIVVELNSDNTHKTINQNEFVLLMGYTPWCPRSAELMPHFAKAANLLTDLGSTLLMAKLDAERYPKLASDLDIKGYPTLILFVNGTSYPYTGGFSAEEIMIWARKKTGEPVVRLTSVTEAEAFVSKYSMFTLGLFEKFEGPQYEEFVKAAIAHDEIQFVETNSHEVAKFLFPELKANVPFVGLVKNEEEKYTVLEEPLKMDSILQFLDNNKFPLVTELTELNSVKVFASPINFQLYVFADSEVFKPLLKTLQEVARKYKSKIMFIYVDITEENLAKPLLTLLGLEDASKTVVASFDNTISSKYLLDSEPTADNLEEFCSGLLHGTIPLHYRSQAVPDNENVTVVAAVGKTFDDLVLSSSQNVILEVYTPWCMSCETMTKKVEKLAKHFKGLENISFARIDASANEHPKLQVDDYPALLFYPARDKSNPIKLSTKSSLKELAAFIKKNVQGEDHAAKDEL